MILSGCSQNIANFTLVSTESTNLDNEYESIGQIEGVDIAYMQYVNRIAVYGKSNGNQYSSSIAVV